MAAVPLYIAESLIPDLKRVFKLLLAVSKPENVGLVASVFTRRGLAYCQKTQAGNNIWAKSEDHLRELLGGALPKLSFRDGQRRSGGAAAGGGASPVPRGRGPLRAPLRRRWLVARRGRRLVPVVEASSAGCGGASAPGSRASVPDPARGGLVDVGVAVDSAEEGHLPRARSVIPPAQGPAVSQ